MKFVPLDRMWNRAQQAKDHSDFFRHLLLTGEFLTKLIAIGLIASLDNDRDRHRYRHEHRVVRANGIGEWAQTITEIVVGPSAQFVLSDAQTERRELNDRTKNGEWQYESLELIQNCLIAVNPNAEKLPRRAEAKRWFRTFTEIRNKTRGHGAELSQLHSRIAPDLEQSIALWLNNYHLFERPWAYLHQNLSGKYRVTRLSENNTPFEPLKYNKSATVPDGVYIYYDRMVLAGLLSSDVDATDFWVPNGNWRKSTYEELSYVTGDSRIVDGSDYQLPVSILPDSETQGGEELHVTGESFSNLPPAPRDYITRRQLESDLRRVLMSRERYPIVTLVGRGGIGKTYLALKVLHDLASEGQYDNIFWFSARDIDLTSDGPKPVKPHILTTDHIALELIRLVEPEGVDMKSSQAVKYMEDSLRKAQPPLENETLMFVFDNSETVNNPADLFTWIDTYIRAPNKVLITTRHREFRGDYPVEVSGMTKEEFDTLVDHTARRLGAYQFLTDEYRQDLFDESDGHPYVAKMLLGEIARAGRPAKVSRIIANRDNILDALFERTYQNLSTVARRVFLTLCNWRSIVPIIALEAVLLRPSNERMDVQMAIDELIQCSFAEILIQDNEETEYLNVPLVAKIFGKRKLKVSPV